MRVHDTESRPLCAGSTYNELSDRLRVERLLIAALSVAAGWDYSVEFKTGVLQT